MSVYVFEYPPDKTLSEERHFANNRPGSDISDSNVLRHTINLAQTVLAECCEAHKLAYEAGYEARQRRAADIHKWLHELGMRMKEAPEEEAWGLIMAGLYAYKILGLEYERHNILPSR